MVLRLTPEPIFFMNEYLIAVRNLFFWAFLTVWLHQKAANLRVWAHEKGTIEEPFVNIQGYHVRPVFALVGGEGR